MENEETKLNERQKTVLKEVCESFISNGVPVGSRNLSKSSRLSCSPATIRNEMADLEEMGYLTSPHTSAGRIPTEKGYKFYVNFLVEFERIGHLEDDLIRRIADVSRENNLRQQDILKSAMKYACEQTHLAGVLLVPQQEHVNWQSVKLIRVVENKAMLIAVDDCANITNQIVDLPPEATDDVLEKLTVMLNAQLCNQQYHHYEQEYIEKTRRVISRYNNLLTHLVKRVKAANKESAEDSVYMEGFMNFFDQPEFSDPEKIKQMAALLNQKENLLNLLEKSLESNSEIVVNIGSDTGLAIKDMSLVTARYRGPNDSFGKIGLIGPLRMNYVNVVATLARLSTTLSQLLIGNQEF